MRQGSLVYGTRGSAGVVSRKRGQKLFPCLSEPMPDSSKLDPLLAKAEPIRDDNNASVITYLRRQNSYCPGGIEIEKWGVIIYETAQQTPSSVEKEAQAVLQVLDRDFPADHGADHGVADVPVQPMEVHRDAGFHLQPLEEPCTRAGECPKVGCNSMGNPC